MRVARREREGKSCQGLGERERARGAEGLGEREAAEGFGRVGL